MIDSGSAKAFDKMNMLLQMASNHVSKSGHYKYPYHEAQTRTVDALEILLKEPFVGSCAQSKDKEAGGRLLRIMKEYGELSDLWCELHLLQ